MFKVALHDICVTAESDKQQPRLNYIRYSLASTVSHHGTADSTSNHMSLQPSYRLQLDRYISHFPDNDLNLYCKINRGLYHLG